MLAAIPCNELDVIPAPPDMVIPMIYIELPVDPSMMFGRSTEADRNTAHPASAEDTASARSSAINTVRCLNYGSSDVVLGNSTPEFRVMSTGVKDPVRSEAYVDIDSAHLVQYGDVIELEDGRLLIDYTAIINGERFFDGEMVFIEENGELYLDSAFLRDEVEIGTWHDVQVSERFTREVKIVEMANGDAIAFDNQSEESMADIVITNPDGETIFEGNAMAVGMVGGETQNIFVAHDLEPGDYTATVTFQERDVTMSITIHVGESNSTPEAATPGA